MTQQHEAAFTRREQALPFARPTVGEEEIAAVVDALRSGWLTTGPRTRLFEERFAAEVGAPAALALSSGTAALHLALVAAGIAPGQLVFTTPLTFCSTAHVIEHVGARPVLVDVDPVTLNLDTDLLRAAVESAAADGADLGAVLPVHFAGQPAAMDDVAAVAREHDLAIVEDAAHAFGASYAGVPVGSVDPAADRHAVCFSLYATKNITTGEGGMLTGSPALLAQARDWSLHGMSRDAWRRYDAGGSWWYDVLHPGFKYNLTDVQAALGLAQLDRARRLEDRRREIAARYLDGLAGLDELDLPVETPGLHHAWHLFVLRLRGERLRIGRDEFVAEMVERRVGMSVHFIPVHEHTYYRERYGFRPTDLPVAHREYTRMCSLPIYPAMSDDDVDYVVAAVRDVLARHRRVG